MWNGFTKLLQLLSGVRRKKAVIDLSVDAGLVIAGPVTLHGIFVTVAMSAHTVALSDAAVTNVIIPASSTAGTHIDTHKMPFVTDLTITPNVSSTGTIVVVYDEIG